MGEQAVNITDLIGSLSQLETWRIIIIVAICGMVGGLSNKLSSPPKDQTHLIGYIIVGAVAALAVLFVHVPSDGVRLIALALAAGYGGRAILNALQNRVKLALTKEEAAKAKKDGREAIQVGQDAIKYAQDMLQYSRSIQRALPPLAKRRRKSLMESLPPRVATIVAKSPEAQADELGDLSARLKYLQKSFEE